MRKIIKYLDTGCSNYISRDKLVFFDLNESCQDFMKFGDEFKVFVIGKGIVAIKTKKNIVYTIFDVLFILE